MMKNITFYQYYSLKIMEIQKSKILVKKIMILLKHHKLSLQKKSIITFPPISPTTPPTNCNSNDLKTKLTYYNLSKKR